MLSFRYLLVGIFNMSCQKLLNIFKFVPNHRQILSECVYYSSTNSNCTLKNYVIGNLLFPLTASFGTSVRHRCKEEKAYINEKDMYIMENDRRLVKHEEDPSMPKVKIIFITRDKKEMEVEARVGMTVLRAGLKYKVPIESACEGKKACTTCHCYVAAKDQEYFTPADLDEDDLIDMAVFQKPTSRLACQLKIIKPFDCVRIELPFATVNFAVDKNSKDEEEKVVQ